MCTRRFRPLALSALVVVLLISALATPAPAAPRVDNPVKLDLAAICRIGTDVHPRTPLVAGSGTTMPSTTTRKDLNNTLTLGKAHKFLGYTTVLLAIATGVTGSEQPHHRGLGYATAGTAAITCITGIIEYGEYFDLTDGLDRNDAHMMLGSLGAIGFIAAAGKNGEGGHQGLGAGSAAAMGIGIALQW